MLNPIIKPDNDCQVSNDRPLSEYTVLNPVIKPDDDYQVPNNRPLSEYTVLNPVIKPDEEYMSMDQTDDHSVSILYVTVHVHYTK